MMLRVKANIKAYANRRLKYPTAAIKAIASIPMPMYCSRCQPLAMSESCCIGSAEGISCIVPGNGFSDCEVITYTLIMKLRRYELGDTEEIIRLFYDTIHEVNIRDYTKAQVDAWTSVNMNVEVWMNSLKSKLTYVAEEDGKILGFGELEANGHIDRFYCHKDFQGQGVGTKILEQIELTARDLEIKKLFLEASITAKPFFEKKKFIMVKKQEVERQEQKLINFVMEKVLFNS